MTNDKIQMTNEIQNPNNKAPGKIRIYNSLTRKQEELALANPPEVNMYTCGVTVYDDCHIGHARSLYVFDVMRKYLEYRGFKVNFVRNITDIDDKIINRANELKIDWKELIGKYIQNYREDLQLLGVQLGKVDKDGEEPRATKSIEDIKKYIQVLIDKGYAYVTSTGVYFSVRKFKDYGKLSGQSIDQMLVGVRKESDETKEDPLDFALWKTSKPDEPSWSSPWGAGRPGWHIECSLMSTKYLKTDTIDIHAGGIDLIFPHHENEIAQSEAKSGKSPFAKFWVHHGLLTINGQKMSKSLGNFVTIKEILNKYSSDVLKIFFLQCHYSSPIDFSWEKMEEAKKAYRHIYILMERLERINYGAGSAAQFKNRFIEYMDNDFNMPGALSVLFDIVNECNKLTSSGGYNNLTTEQMGQLKCAWETMKEISGIFGLTFLKNQSSPLTDDDIECRISFRKTFKKEKKYKEADEIRKKLKEDGVILEDTKDGETSWRRES